MKIDNLDITERNLEFENSIFNAFYHILNCTSQAFNFANYSFTNFAMRFIFANQFRYGIFKNQMNEYFAIKETYYLVSLQHADGH